MPEDFKEIPRTQRYAERPSLPDIFDKQASTDKTMRNLDIYTAHVVYHYTLREIADYLGIHYATVSKAVKKGEKDQKYQGKT